MVLDALSMHACDCGPSEGLLHTDSAGTEKSNTEKKKPRSCLFHHLPKLRCLRYRGGISVLTPGL